MAAVPLREATAIGSMVDMVDRRLIPPTWVRTTIYAPRGPYMCIPHSAWFFVHGCPRRPASGTKERQCGGATMPYNPNQWVL